MAKRLSEKLGVTHIDLDTIRQPGGNNTKRSIQERFPYVQEVAKRKTWVTEGIYLAWVKVLLDNADQIIFLDISPVITIPRVLLRYIHRVINGRNKYGFFNEMSLVTDIINYHYPKAGQENSIEDRFITRRKTLTALRQYKQKTIILRGTKSVNKYLQSLSY